MCARLVVGGLAALFLISLIFLGTAPGISTPAEEATPLQAGGDWVAPRLGSPQGVVIDTRPGKDYLEGHLPGAQSLLPDNLRSMSNGVPGEVFPPEVLSVVFGRLGVASDSRVVVYGQRIEAETTFVASLLRALGVARVTILEGGFESWKKEGRPVTKERPRVAATRPQFSWAEPMFVGLEEFKRAAASREALIVDARGEEAFLAGHVPGARLRPYTKDFVPPGSPGEGLPRPLADLAGEYQSLGLDPARPVIVYCGSGFTASSVYYTLRHRMGLANVRVYDGSWVEWSGLPSPEVEKSAEGSPRARAERAARSLAADLMARLGKELGEGGPANAVTVCSQAAPEIARSLSTGGLTIRRVTQKPRNPQNQPDAWEKVELEKYAALMAQGQPLNDVAVIVGEGAEARFRFLRPITIGKTCLKCHGKAEDQDPCVKQVLSGKYPQDQATGYREGDFRGAISVTLPAE